MDVVVAEQQKAYCDLLEQWAFSEENAYYAAINLSIDMNNHPYREAILFGWFVLHGGLHALLNNFPALKHYYARQHAIPLPMRAYVLVQIFIAFKHLGGGSEFNGRGTDENERQKRELKYHERHCDWFRRRFHQVVV